MKTTHLLTHLLTLLLTATTALGQGPLAPLVAPGPTMKTLDQIEPRIPIPSAPIVPIVGPHFTITKPGSYYLTGNITVSSGDAITINAANVASDVSIDLNGFTIRSTLTGSASGNAIYCTNTFTRLTVRNGSLVSTSNATSVPPILQGFARGIYSGFGTGFSEALINNLHVSGMANSGIFLHERSIVENCTATNNGGEGIYAPGSTVTNCIVTGNGGSGISASSGNVTNCLARSNNGGGISASSGTVINCRARSNGGNGIFASDGVVTNCRASSNGNDGIYAFAGIVTNCQASGNSNDGIEVNGGVVAHCVATGNDPDAIATDYQIKVTAGSQRIGNVPATEAGSP